MYLSIITNYFQYYKELDYTRKYFDRYNLLKIATFFCPCSIKTRLIFGYFFAVSFAKIGL